MRTALTETPTSGGDDTGHGAALAVQATPPARVGFEVHLGVFEGPFDLLLSLIAKHELDITSVSLSKVTDEFIAHIRQMGPVLDLGQASEFLVVAATLVDLKAARLLPAAEIEDEDDLALLEARDLLFARLLQYRAYKQVAAIFAELLATESRRFARAVGPEPRFAGLLPEVLLGLGPHQFAELAARALAPKLPALVSVAHLHTPTVSVREQAAIVSERLRRSGAATFRSLTAECTATVEVVARFLALLELFRDGMVAFEQLTPLGDLLVRWTGHGEPGESALADTAMGIGSEFDAPNEYSAEAESPSRDVES
ncbi:MAG: segregation and condensation protein [Actinomycetota bacterium]|jgi:segregation and condensation protein A|nr:segregation and condensation protein [Actinomycetota bacterium]